MEIRTATPADLAAVTALEAACFPPAEAAGEASFQARLTAFPDSFWLLVEGGRVLAMVNGMVTQQPDLTDAMYDDASLHDPAGPWQMIFGVATHPDCRTLLTGLPVSGIIPNNVSDFRSVTWL